MISSLTVSASRLKVRPTRCLVCSYSAPRNTFQPPLHRFQISFKQLVNKTQISLQPRLHAFHSEMANLSQNNHNIIAEHPLNSSLDHLQDLLRKTKKSCDAADHDSDQGLQKAILKLLDILLLFEAVNYLFSQTENRDVASDLLRLRKCIQKDDFNYQHY